MDKNFNPRSDLCDGVAFTAARSALAAVAGDAFRRLAELKADPQASSDAIEAARSAAHRAQARALDLRPDDAAGIDAALRPL